MATHQLRRRRFVSLAATFGAFLAAPFQAPALQVASLNTGCIGALRLVNTLQNATRKSIGRYLSAQELMGGADLAAAVAYANSDRELTSLGFSIDRWQSTGEFVPGFRLAFQPAAGPLQYSVVLTEIGGTAAYWTNESGVISVGAFAMRQEAIALNGRGLRNPSAPNGRWADLVAFFVPTLHARHQCCDGPCGYCYSQSPCDCAPATCCNLGFQDCPWCCRSGVDYPWQCLAGLCGLCL